MAKVIIGVDPHKRSATIEIINGRGQALHTGRYDTGPDGYRAMLATGRGHRDRVWAVEGCNGTGRPLAQRLLADGETVIDVPAKLSAQARVFATGQGRKTDPADAHHIAVAALRTPGLRQVTTDPQLEVLRLLIDRREQLTKTRTQTVSRLHLLLSELIAGGAKKNLTTTQARALLAGITPTTPAAQLRHRLAAELVDDLTTLDTRTRAADRELAQHVTATGSTLTTLFGIGSNSAARLLADIGDITRFTDRGRFASWNGTAPLDASSGEHTRHRLSRKGNRRINRVLHTMATCQLRHDTEGRAYYRRKLAAGKTSMEAIRALKRRLSDHVYRHMTRDQTPPATNTETGSGTGPGGHTGATTNSSATGPTPTTGTSDKSQPEPATTHPNHTHP